MLDKIRRMSEVFSECVERSGKHVAEWASEPLVERDIVQTNIDLMLVGLRPDGSEISPKYATGKSYWDETYADYKRTGAGSRYDVPERPFDSPNLALSGDFHRSVHVEVGDDGFEVTASDYKWESPEPGKQSIHERYGDVLGVPDEYLEQVARPEIAKIMADKIKDKLCRQ